MSENKYDIDQTVVSSSGNLFFKRPDGKFKVRFYPCKLPNGKLRVGQHVISHWVENKNYPCTGTGCVHCKAGVPQQNRKKIGVVNRMSADISTQRVQIWQMPISVWGQLQAHIDENGDGCIGDDGADFAITYDSAKSPAQQYTMVVSQKGSVVLSLDSTVPFFDKPAVVEEGYAEQTAEQIAQDAKDNEELFAGVDGVDDVIETLG